MNKLNVHVYPSNLKSETRIQKIVSWLAANSEFDLIYVVGIRAAHLKNVQRYSKRVCFIRIPNGKGSAFGLLARVWSFAVWSLSILFLFSRRDIVCVNAHSLSSLPICVALKIIKRAKLVYDTHELETEVSTSKGVRKVLAKFVESVCIRFVDETVVVSQGIGEWYQASYGCNTYVVRNIPEGRPLKLRNERLRFEIGIKHTDVLVLYLGALAYGRNVDLIARNWKHAPDNWHLVIVGSGPLEQELKSSCSGFSNVHFLAPVSPSEVVELSSGADIGLSLLEEGCLSHEFALPNKLFEYLHAGVPVVVNELTEMKKVVQSERCGWVLTPANFSSLFQVTMIEIAERAAYARRASSKYLWENELKQLRMLYCKLGFFLETK